MNHCFFPVTTDYAYGFWLNRERVGNWLVNCLSWADPVRPAHGLELAYVVDHIVVLTRLWNVECS